MSNLEEATEVKGQYGAGQIQVLEGLEAVRKGQVCILAVFLPVVCIIWCMKQLIIV